MTNASRSILLLAAILSLFASVGLAAGAIAPSSDVEMSQALNDARFIASMHADAQVMKISGVSMLPYFNSGSLVVVKPISEESFRKGMVIVYRNRFGETVAHKLMSRSNEGWTAKGFNNSESDSTLVNASNVIGVVYATVHTAGDDVSAAALPVALAAPAR